MAAKSGMLMMLKSLGIDVDEVQKQINTQLGNIEKFAGSIDARLAAMQEQQNKIALALVAVMRKLEEKNGDSTSNPDPDCRGTRSLSSHATGS